MLSYQISVNQQFSNRAAIIEIAAHKTFTIMYTQKQVADTISAIMCYLNHDEGFNTENALCNHLKDVIKLDDDLITHINYLIVNNPI